MTAPAATDATTTAALAASYATATQALRSRLTAIVTALFGQQGYRDAGADAYVAQAVPASIAAQQTMSALTEAYLAHQLSAQLGVTTAPMGVATDLVTGAALRGVDPAEVYRRPYTQLWWDLSQGKPFEQAVQAAGRRAESIAVTDLQLAKTHTARQVLDRAPRQVVGYRRELGSDPHHCALCLLTSSRVYHKADLLPLHPGCSCTPTPVVEGEQVPELDAAAVHDAIRSDLGEKYVQAGGRGPVSYRDIVITHHHGELGPVLGVRGQQWTGPADIPSLTQDRIGG